jgi:hypothetical protein
MMKCLPSSDVVGRVNHIKKISGKDNPKKEKKMLREEVPILVDSKNDLIPFLCPVSATC